MTYIRRKKSKYEEPTPISWGASYKGEPSQKNTFSADMSVHGGGGPLSAKKM